MSDLALDLKKLIDKKIGSISGLTLESLIYISLNSPRPLCVFLNKNLLENISVIMQEEVGEKIVCVSNHNNSLDGFDNFYNKMFQISTQALGVNKKVFRVCFVDSLAAKQKFLPVNQKSGFWVNKNTVFEHLIENLNLLGYSEKNNIFNNPGSFFVNGGIIDINPIGTQKNYRISFLDEWCSIYNIDNQTNLIKTPVNSLQIYPPCLSKKISPFEFCKNDYFLTSFQNNRLALFEKNNKKTTKTIIKDVDYQGFIGQNNYNRVFELPFDSEKGFVVGKDTYIPAWFQNKKLIKEPINKKNILSGFGSLNIGSIYVHEDFGLCRFMGIEVLNKQERICLRFLDGLVKLDIHYISKLSFYSNDTETELNHLNKPGKWNRQKQKAQKLAKEYVAHIIKAYSERENSQTEKLNVDDSFIEVFVNKFKHKDTPDQKKCWEEVLGDLASKTPMNRLICGDVGFGKTEIIIRAAFVSVLNNQQVVVLAPTTILANQLYHSFVRRMDGFGVKISVLSSLSSKKNNIVNMFVNKKRDILIGTSALLFKKEILKSCQLFIVDEEHRFGVKDKELVLSLNPSVNFLSLSATPIPRSLQLSLNNVRSLSTMETPPASRKPVISFVHSYDTTVIKNSILKEIKRGGQVFFVDNSVENLKKILASLKIKLPFISMGLIYSKLNKKTLLDTMNDFVFGKTQVLFSTSIIESGIDIGLANTIIINNAHMFGLSQLYQLRGRVGRSTQQAFAWFLIPQKDQTVNGKRRLKTIVKNTSLGSGYKIALSDLDIRGGGSLFGYKQSGDGGVGFEFYTKLISLAVNKKTTKDVVVDIFNITLSRAVGDEGQRGYFYKSVFEAHSLSEVDQIKKDFIALFGSTPSSFLSLLKSRKLGILASEKKITRIVKTSGWVCVVFSPSITNKEISLIVSYTGSFFSAKKTAFQFVQSEKNLSFKYKSKDENDYILLLSFINNLSI